jgi:hypothetical protein
MTFDAVGEHSGWTSLAFQGRLVWFAFDKLEV